MSPELPPKKQSERNAPSGSTPPTSPPPKPTAPGHPVVGVKSGPSELPDPRTLIEKTASALGGILSPLKSKLAAIRSGDAQPPPPAIKAERTKAPEVASEPPPPPRLVVALNPRAANVSLDRVVIRVAEGAGQKANAALGRKGIRNAKVDGDRLEFDAPSNRVSTVLTALLESHVELYGLERTARPVTPSSDHEPSTRVPGSDPPPARL